jgi:Alpha 1,4-glycosyltransferase conserved region
VLEVNAFWDGELSSLETLCITSFLRHGVGYNLYVYDEPAKVPSGVILKDAEAILPRDKVFRYAAGEFNLASIAGFTNLFRYTVIHQRGGWWIDTDVCLLKPFDFPGEEVYFEESSQTEAFYVATSCFKAAPQSAVMNDCLRRFAEKDVKRIVHGETGPRLLTDSIVALGKQNCVLHRREMMPVPWWDWHRLFYDEALSLADCYAVHFWSAMITAEGADKNAPFPTNAPFERLKRAYLA